MKKKITVLSAIFVMAAVTMTACAQVKPDSTSETQQSEVVSEEIQQEETQQEESQQEEVQIEETRQEDTQQEETQIEETRQEETPIEVTAAYISDEEIAELDEATTIMLGDADQEYVSHVLIQVSAAVSDMILWDLSADFTEDGNETIEVTNKIAEAADVNTDDYVIVSVQESEILPWNGISFEDAAGELHFMYISWSGEDGHPFLTEFVPNQEELPE